MGSLPTEQISLITAGLAFIASLIAGGISLYNSRFNKYVYERWWDAKIDVYTKIIDALSDVVEYYRQLMHEENSGRELPKGKKEEIRERMKQGYDEVRKAANFGAYIVSQEAGELIKKYRHEDKKERYPDGSLYWFGTIENELMTAEKCLKDIISVARKDLDIDRGKNWITIFSYALLIALSGIVGFFIGSVMK